MHKAYSRPTLASFGTVAALTAATGINGAVDQSPFAPGVTLHLEDGSITIDDGSQDICLGYGDNTTPGNDASC